MKDVIFLAVSHVHFLTTTKIKSVAEFLLSLTTATTSMILKIIDKERMHYAQSAVDQVNVISELQILCNIQEVRNNAVKIGEWNEDHEGQLNFLGNVLCNEHDWEVEEVERYLHEIISTGPAVNLED